MFLTWLDGLTSGWAHAFSDNKGINNATAKLEAMAGVAAKWGQTIALLFKLIGNVISASLPTGVGLLNDMNGGLKNLVTNTSAGHDGFKRLQDFFEGVKAPFKAVIGFLGALAKGFLELGTNPAVTSIFDKLAAAMPEVESAIATFTTKVAPAMVDILKQVLDIFNNLAHSTAFTIFVAIIKAAITVIADFVKVLQWGPIGKFTGALLGLVAAVIALKKLGKVTGVSALVQSVRQGVAPAGSERQAKASGLGAFIQGARGNPVVGKSRKVHLGEVDDEGKPIKTLIPGKETTASRLGGRFAAGGRTRTIARAGAAAAGVATIGLALDAASHAGKIHGLGDAIKAVGSTITDNLTTILTLAAPQIFSVIGKGAGKLGGISGILGGIGKFAGIAATGLRTVGIAMATALGPIGLAIAAGVILAAGLFILYKRSKTFRDIVHDVWKALKTAADFIAKVAVKVFDQLKSHLGLVLVALGPFGVAILGVIEIFKHWHEIEKIVKAVFSVVLTVFKVGMAPILVVAAVFKDLVVGAFKLMGNLVVTVVTTWWNVIKIIFTTAKDVVVGIVVLLKDLVTGNWGKLKNDVLAIVGALWNGVRGIFNAMVGYFVGIGKAIWSAIVGAFRSIKSDVLGIIGEVWNGIKSLPGRILGLARSMLNAGKSIGSAIWNGIKSGLTATGSFVENIGIDIVNMIIGFVDHNVIDQINHALRDISVFGHRPFGRHTIPDIPYIGGSGGGAGSGGSGGAARYVAAASGATINPRPGGTLALLAEAGRPESVVDTGLINQRLRDDQNRNDATVSELQRLREILQRIERLGGINVEQLLVQAHENERADESVPRSLRSLAFEMGF
jgi:phage-related protein